MTAQRVPALTARFYGRFGLAALAAPSGSQSSRRPRPLNPA